MVKQIGQLDGPDRHLVLDVLKTLRFNGYKPCGLAVENLETDGTYDEWSLHWLGAALVKAGIANPPVIDRADSHYPGMPTEEMLDYDVPKYENVSWYWDVPVMLDCCREYLRQQREQRRRRRRARR